MKFSEQLSAWRIPVRDSKGRVVAHEKSIRYSAKHFGVSFGTMVNWACRGIQPHPNRIEAMRKKMGNGK